MTKGWRNDPYRHSLSSRGIKNVSQQNNQRLNVYVGGRETPRMKQGGASAITDVSNAFHTSLDRKTPYYFAESKDYIYKMELDLNKLPKEKVLMPEDWTEEMVDTFTSFGRIDFKDLKKTRPDLVEHLKEKENYGRYITTGMLSDEQPLAVFSYPPEELTPDRGTLIEEEVAIFDEEFLKDEWEEKEKVPKEKVFDEDIKTLDI